MPVPKKVAKAKIVAITTAAAAGSSHRALMLKHPDVSERTIRVLRQNGVSVDEWRSEVTRGLRAAVDETIIAYRTAISDGKVPPSAMAVSAGIFYDKLDKLENRTQVTDLNIAVLVNNFAGGISREQLIASLSQYRTPASIPAVTEIKSIGE